MQKLDLFASIQSDDKLHPQFRRLRDSLLFLPARSLLCDIANEFDDPDGNFVQQFQTAGFDARTFEIYLFAMFKANGFVVDRSCSRPDFIIRKNRHTLCVEAVTANPSPSKLIRPYEPFPDERAPHELRSYYQNEVPINFGSPLFSKLRKQYWNLPHVSGNLIIFAIQNFHKGALWASSSSLAEYLYGLSHLWYHDHEGKLIISAKPLKTHRHRMKEIPSGFFAQPGAEHVSAVLFSNVGTAAKFNRLGVERGHHSRVVRLIRYGTCYRFDPNATIPSSFVYEVGNAGAIETLAEGTVLMHNPYALHPIQEGLVGACAEERIEDRQVVTYFSSGFHPYASFTVNFPSHTADSIVRGEMDRVEIILHELFPP